MSIESIITSIARNAIARSLHFSPSTSLSFPRGVGDPTFLYIHVPFCEELCPYCSFHRIVFNEGLARAYFEALRKEITMYKVMGFDFKALYVGGGTPTVLIDELCRTLGLIQETYNVTEISVETNPNHLTKSNREILKKAGVNRLSIGVQSFDDGLLKAMGRYHKHGSGTQIAERLQATQGVFDTLNADMIFNFPLQTMGILERDLSILIELGVDQITYYPLMVSSSSEALIKRTLGVVDYKREKGFYRTIARMLAPYYQASTAWCFSKNDAMIDEYVVNFGEYAGLGSGSFGYVDGTIYANTFDIGDYIKRVNDGAFPIMAQRVFTPRERLQYDLLMKLFGLRLDLEQLSTKTKRGIYRYLWPEILFFWVTGGLRRHGTVLSLTPRGRYYWVIMMREFFIGVNNFRDFCRAQLSDTKTAA